MNPHDEDAKTRTALVVDDEDGLRALLQTAFSAFGYEADLAASGQEALACLSRRSYDVVICDLLMPGMTGDELFRICREEHPQVASRFIFLSGHSGGLPSTDFAAHWAAVSANTLSARRDTEGHRPDCPTCRRRLSPWHHKFGPQGIRF